MKEQQIFHEKLTKINNEWLRLLKWHMDRGCAVAVGSAHNGSSAIETNTACKDGKAETYWVGRSGWVV